MARAKKESKVESLVETKTAAKKKVKLQDICSLCKEREVVVSNVRHGRGVCFQCAIGFIDNITSEMNRLESEMKELAKGIDKKVKKAKK